tara:strand:- start:699 stop:1382 length:684 start_codon:yes stop_codon:yes gene_type:complete
MSFQLKQHATSIYTVDGTLKNNPIGRRMIVFVLPNKCLALHSPILPDQALQADLAHIGNVSTIFVPNLWHTLDTKSVHNMYPKANIYVPNALQTKLNSKFSTDFTYEQHWTDLLDQDLTVFNLQGLKQPEVVFFHKPSKTLIITDLFFNFLPTDFSGLTKWAMQANKALRFGTTRLYKLAMISDKNKLKASINHINKSCDISSIIVCHGHIIKTDAKLKLQQAIDSL